MKAGRVARRAWDTGAASVKVGGRVPKGGMTRRCPSSNPKSPGVGAARRMSRSRRDPLDPLLGAPPEATSTRGSPVPVLTGALHLLLRQLGDRAPVRTTLSEPAGDACGGELTTHEAERSDLGRGEARRPRRLPRLPTAATRGQALTRARSGSPRLVGESHRHPRQRPRGPLSPVGAGSRALRASLWARRPLQARSRPLPTFTRPRARGADLGG